MGFGLRLEVAAMGGLLVADVDDEGGDGGGGEDGGAG